MQSKWSRLLALAFGLCIMAAIPAFAQQVTGKHFEPLNMKLGLWQTTSDFTNAGEMPIPPDMLEQMTPAQRAQAQALSGAKSFTNTSCVTKENLQNPFTGKECTWTILESTASKARGNISCDYQGMTLTGTGDFEAIDSQHVKGSEHLKATAGDRTMTTDGTFTSKWIDSKCEGGD